MINKILFGFVLTLVISACVPSMSRVGDNAYSDENATVIVDLEAVLKATGQDEIINNNMKAVNADLTLQLGDIVTNFNKQLARQKKKYGADITVDEQQKMQEMLIKANQLLSQKQIEANLKAKQHKEGLINVWRKKIQPLVRSIADKKGAKVVLVQSLSVMWFDSVIDITDEVIAALRKKPVKNNEKSSKVKIPIGSGDVI